jgi:hypothetical protein
MIPKPMNLCVSGACPAIKLLHTISGWAEGTNKRRPAACLPISLSVILIHHLTDVPGNGWKWAIPSSILPKLLLALGASSHLVDDNSSCKWISIL